MTDDTIEGHCPRCPGLQTLRIDGRTVTCESCGATVDEIEETRSERRERRRQERRAQRMTVADLREQLADMPDDAPIHIVAAGAWDDLRHVRERDVTYNTGYEETVVEFSE